MVDGPNSMDDVFGGQVVGGRYLSRAGFASIERLAFLVQGWASCRVNSAVLRGCMSAWLPAFVVRDYCSIERQTCMGLTYDTASAQ